MARGNGEGTIFKRKDGKWQGAFTVGIDPQTGKQKRKYFYGDTEKETKQKMKKYKNKYNLLNISDARADKEKLTLTIQKPFFNNEKEWQEYLMGIAKILGWKVAHIFAKGAGGKGVPDLLLTRNGRTIFCELKHGNGVLKSEQKKWLDELNKNDHIETYCLRPEDWSKTISLLISNSKNKFA